MAAAQRTSSVASTAHDPSSDMQFAAGAAPLASTVIRRVLAALKSDAGNDPNSAGMPRRVRTIAVPCVYDGSVPDAQFDAATQLFERFAVGVVEGIQRHAQAAAQSHSASSSYSLHLAATCVGDDGEDLGATTATGVPSVDPLSNFPAAGAADGGASAPGDRGGVNTWSGVSPIEDPFVTCGATSLLVPAAGSAAQTSPSSGDSAAAARLVVAPRYTTASRGEWTPIGKDAYAATESIAGAVEELGTRRATAHRVARSASAAAARRDSETPLRGDEDYDDEDDDATPRHDMPPQPSRLDGDVVPLIPEASVVVELSIVRARSYTLMQQSQMNLAASAVTSCVTVQLCFVPVSGSLVGMLRAVGDSQQYNFQGGGGAASDAGGYTPVASSPQYSRAPSELPRYRRAGSVAFSPEFSHVSQATGGSPQYQPLQASHQQQQQALPPLHRSSLAFFFALVVHEALVTRTATITVASFTGGGAHGHAWIERLHRALHRDRGEAVPVTLEASINALCNATGHVFSVPLAHQPHSDDDGGGDHGHHRRPQQPHGVVALPILGAQAHAPAPCVPRSLIASGDAYFVLALADAAVVRQALPLVNRILWLRGFLAKASAEARQRTVDAVQSKSLVRPEDVSALLSWAEFISGTTADGASQRRGGASTLTRGGGGSPAPHLSRHGRGSSAASSGRLLDDDAADDMLADEIAPRPTASAPTPLRRTTPRRGTHGDADDDDLWLNRPSDEQPFDSSAKRLDAASAFVAVTPGSADKGVDADQPWFARAAQPSTSNADAQAALDCQSSLVPVHTETQTPPPRHQTATAPQGKDAFTSSAVEVRDVGVVAAASSPTVRDAGSQSSTLAPVVNGPAPDMHLEAQHQGPSTTESGTNTAAAAAMEGETVAAAPIQNAGSCQTELSGDVVSAQVLAALYDESGTLEDAVPTPTDGEIAQEVRAEEKAAAHLDDAEIAALDGASLADDHASSPSQRGDGEVAEYWHQRAMDLEDENARLTERARTAETVVGVLRRQLAALRDTSPVDAPTAAAVAVAAPPSTAAAAETDDDAEDAVEGPGSPKRLASTTRPSTRASTAVSEADSFAADERTAAAEVALLASKSRQLTSSEVEVLRLRIADLEAEVEAERRRGLEMADDLDVMVQRARDERDAAVARNDALRTAAHDLASERARLVAELADLKSRPLDHQNASPNRGGDGAAAPGSLSSPSSPTSGGDAMGEAFHDLSRQLDALRERNDRERHAREDAERGLRTSQGDCDDLRMALKEATHAVAEQHQELGRLEAMVASRDAPSRHVYIQTDEGFLRSMAGRSRGTIGLDPVPELIPRMCAVGVDTEPVRQSPAGCQTISTLTAARGSSPMPQTADPALTDARRELRAANVQIMALQNELQAAQDDKQNIQRTLMALGMAKSEADEKAELTRRAYADSDNRIEQLSDENAELRAWVEALRNESERLLQYAQASERDRADLLNVNETLKTLNSVPAGLSATHGRTQSRHAPTPGAHGSASAAARRSSTQASRSPSNQPSEAPLPTTTRAYYPTHTSVTTRVNSDGSPGGVRSPSPRVVPSHNPTVTGQLSHITDSDRAHFGGFFRGSTGAGASSSPPLASTRRPSGGAATSTPTRRPPASSGEAHRVAGSPLTNAATSARYGSPAIRQGGITRPSSTTRR